MNMKKLLIILLGCLMPLFSFAGRTELGALTISNNLTVTGVSTLEEIKTPDGGIVTFTNAESVQVLNAVNNQDAMTLGQSLELMGSRSTLYLSTNTPPKGVAGQTNRTLAATGNTSSWSIVVTTNAVAGSYLFNFIAPPTGLVTTIIPGVMTSRMRIVRNSGGGAYLTMKIEGYIFNTNTLAKTEYAETAEALTIGTTVNAPQDFYNKIPYFTNLNASAGEVFMISGKAVTANNITSITISGGGTTLSYIELPTPAAIDLGVRGAASIKTSDNSATGTYDNTARVLILPNSYTFGTSNIIQSGAVYQGTNAILWQRGTNNYYLLLP